jgi:hypothetical protein
MVTAARSSLADKFTRSGLSMTYLPGVARPLSCWMLVKRRAGEDVEMPKLRVG